MISTVISRLNDSYSKYREEKLNRKRVTHKEVVSLIQPLKKRKDIVVKKAGTSIEGRGIYLLKFGRGKTKILLWSQMHGDEPTATLAFFDLFNFLMKSDEYDSIRKELFSKLTLYFVPMLNPDGAERITRENAAGIDLNRDALALQSPESKILINVVEKIKPDFSFNMHDQDFRWAAGDTNKMAALALLAPVFDSKKTINKSREKAIKLVASIYNEFSNYLPGRIARYGDGYEPRSFGDMIAGRNSSTILVEAGKLANDPDKIILRKMNFILMVYSFLAIAKESYKSTSVEEYFKIPNNGNFLFDLLIKNATLKLKGKNLKVDIAINLEEKYFENERIPYYVSSVELIGDSKGLYGIEEFDAAGLTIVKGKCSKMMIDPLKLDLLTVQKALLKGELCIPVKSGTGLKPYTQFSVNFVTKKNKNNFELKLKSPANFYLYKKEKPAYVVINGKLLKIDEINGIEHNGLVF